VVRAWINRVVRKGEGIIQKSSFTYCASWSKYIILRVRKVYGALSKIYGASLLSHDICTLYLYIMLSICVHVEVICEEGYRENNLRTFLYAHRMTLDIDACVSTSL